MKQKQFGMHLHSNSGENLFEISETFVDYTLNFNFHDTNLKYMFLKKQFVLNQSDEISLNLQ